MAKSVTFFLVDDDEDDTMLFREVLNDIEPQAEFRSAPNGKDALEMLQNEAIDLPDLIFLDLNMPRMNGRECLQQIKMMPRLAHTPVVIYTTSSHLKDIEETMNQGAIGLIAKPSDLKELKTILKALVENAPDRLDSALRYLRDHTTSLIVC